MRRGFIGGIISTVVGLIFLYFIWQFAYDAFPSIRPLLDNTVTAVSQGYQWAVNEYGTATVGGVIVVAALFLIFNKR